MGTSMIVGRYAGGPSAYSEALLRQRSVPDTDPLATWEQLSAGEDHNGQSVFQIGHVRLTGPRGLEAILESELGASMWQLMHVTPIEHGELCSVDWRAAKRATERAAAELRVRVDGASKERADHIVNCLEGLDVVDKTCDYVLAQPDPTEFMIAWW